MKNEKDRKIDSIKNEIETLREANIRLESENKTLKKELKSETEHQAEQSIKGQLKPVEDISENVSGLFKKIH